MGVLCAAAANDGSEDNEKMINAKINSASVGREARRDRHMGCVLSGSGPCYGRAIGEVKPECAENQSGGYNLRGSTRRHKFG